MIFHDFRKFLSASVCFHMFLDSPRRAWMLLDALDAPGSCVAVCSPHFQVWSFIEKKVRIFRCRGLAEKSQIQIFRKKIDFFFSKKIDFFFLAQKIFWVDLGMGKHPNHRFSMFNWSSARCFEYFWQQTIRCGQFLSASGAFISF